MDRSELADLPVRLSPFALAIALLVWFFHHSSAYEPQVVIMGGLGGWVIYGIWRWGFKKHLWFPWLSATQVKTAPMTEPTPTKQKKAPEKAQASSLPPELQRGETCKVTMMEDDQILIDVTTPRHYVVPNTFDILKGGKYRRQGDGLVPTE